MAGEIIYNPKYTLSDTVKRLLELSKQEVESMEERSLKCPICGFHIQGVYGHSGYVNVKCQKCKFNGPLSLAYFRRQNPHTFRLNTHPKKKQER